MRMIDADKLNEKIKMPEYAEQNNLYNIGYHNALEFVKFLIEIYTFDVELVKHGKWIFKNGYLGNTYYCSECEKAVYLDKFEEPNLTDFCPDCGARMDGDENEQEKED